MPLYYFCLHDEECVSDPDGTELPDVAAASEHAESVARELMFRRDRMLGRGWSAWTMSVRDADGAEVLSFPLADVRDGSGEGR